MGMCSGSLLFRLLFALPVLAGCSSDDPADALEVTLRVVDESDRPIAGSTVDVDGERTSTDSGGLAPLAAPNGPVVAVVSARGHLAEPVPIGWEDAGQTLTVKL